MSMSKTLVIRNILVGVVLFIILVLVLLNTIVRLTVISVLPVAIGTPVSIEELDINIWNGKVAADKINVGDSAGLNAEKFLTVERVDAALWKGNAEVKNVAIANPEGFKEKYLLTLEHAKLGLDTKSLNTEKLRITEFSLSGLDLHYEAFGENGNNIEKIQEYVKKTFKIPESKEEKTDAKKLQVDVLRLKDIRLHTFIFGKKVTLELAPIEVKDLGSGPEGITSGEVLFVILDKLLLESLQTIKNEVVKLGGNLKESSTKKLKEATEGVKKNMNSLIKVFK